MVRRGLVQEVHNVHNISLKTKAGRRKPSVQKVYLLEDVQSKQVQSEDYQSKDVQIEELPSERNKKPWTSREKDNKICVK